MTDNVKKVLRAFKAQPYKVRMGARTQAKRLNVPVEDVREARRIFHLMNSPKKLRVLILDIETSPMKAWIWRRWKENIYFDQTIQEWFMLSWSAKWLGEREAFGDVLTSEEVAKEDDKRILMSLYELLNEADIVVAHNGIKFDIPKINTRFILNDVPIPTPYKQVDTYYVAKKQFGFSSSSLDALATFFGFPNKDPHDFQLWKECMEGKEESLLRLLKYNKKDVEILEKVYIKLRPWIKNHPNVNVITNSPEPMCTHCGSTNIEEIEDASYNTQAYKYSVFRCKDCGAIFRSKQRISLQQNYTSLA